MNKLFDTLEICLQELENGAELETVLANYPDLAAELRPILTASINARMRSAAVAAPSAEVVRRGRAKLLQRASEMREQKVAPRKRMIPIFQRLAISLTLTTIFLASGTGLVGASSSSLPGENLYPVKRTWEDVRLLFTLNPNQKELLKSEFESERLNEVDGLLAEGRDETIQYSGIFTDVNGLMYVSGVKVLIPANLQVPVNGAAVIVTGKTNAQGFVEIESITLLPDGAKVPVGKPVEAEDGSDSSSDSGTSSENGTSSNSGSTSEGGAATPSSTETKESNTSATLKPTRQSFEMKGAVASIANNLLVVNGQTVYLGNANVDGVLKPGVSVEIRGFYAADGSFVVTDVQVTEPGSGGGSSNDNSGSGSSSGSSDNSGSNSNDSSNSNNDHGGSGGGGDGSGSDH